MRRLECLEKNGWKVSIFLSGNGAIATKNKAINTTILYKLNVFILNSTDC